MRNLDRKICSVDECGGPGETRGWCGMHYTRWKRHGAPTVKLSPGRPAATKEDAFFSGIPEGLSASECWPWIRQKKKEGYGALSWNGEWWLAHRFSYDLHFPDLLDHDVVRHACHNRVCVNPHHLIGGTQKENIADKLDAGTHTWGASHATARFTEEQAHEIRRRYSSGEARKSIARDFDCPVGTVNDIGRRVNWKRLPEQAPA